VSLPSSSQQSNGLSQTTGEPIDEVYTTQHNSDEDMCADFLRRTCGCKKASGKPCSSLFPLEHYITLHAQSAILTHNEVDMVLLGSVMSTTLNDTHSVKDGRHKSAKRSKVSSNFMHHGHNMVKPTFSFLYGIGINHRIVAIRKHYQEEGLEPRIH